MAAKKATRKRTVKRSTKKSASKKSTPKNVRDVKTKCKCCNKDNCICSKAMFVLASIVIIVLALWIFGGNEMIEQGSKVKLHYTGTLDDGSVFDSSKDKDPLEFEVGQGQVIPGFEEGVIGLKAGDKKTINIPADKAYGSYDEKRIGEYPKSNVPENMEVKIGAKIFLQSPDGGVAIATIKEIKDDILLLDLNHPLAGKDLTFEIEIIEIN